MNFMKKDEMKTSKTSGISVILYAASVVVALVAVAELITNIYIYKTTVSQYVAQGYPAAEVIKQLLPSQLLPGIFQPVAVYGGIAVLLFGAGKIYNKVSKCVMPLSDTDACCDNSVDEVPATTETEPENVPAEESAADENKQA